MIPYFHTSRIITVCIILFISFFANYSKAEAINGYSFLEPTTKDSLTYKALENNEVYSDVTNCFNPADITRNPEIVTKIKNQSSCFDKYGVAGELREKLTNTNQSLEKLNFYKKITQLTLDNFLKIDNAIKSNLVNNEYSNLNFLIIPNGKLTEIKIKKEIEHEAMCKIDSLYGFKVPVQSSKEKEVNFSIFVENTKDQINRIQNNVSDFHKIINKSEDGRFDVIARMILVLKANTLANDLTLFDADNFEFANSQLSSISNTSAFVEIKISDNSQIDSKNPSGKILNISINYPKLDSNSNLIREDIILPPMYLETFKNDISPKILSKLKERITEYDYLINDFSKNQRNLSTSISTIEKDSFCYNNLDSRNYTNTNITQEVNTEQKINSFEKQTFMVFISNIWDKTLTGVSHTFSSVSDTTKKLVTINPSPTPIPAIYKVLNSNINPSTSPSVTTSPTPYPRASTTSTPRPSTTPVPTASPSYSPRPSPTISSTPKPSITPYPSTSSTPRPSTTPYPSTSSTPGPSTTPYYSPSPTPLPSTSATPTPTSAPSSSPTPTPTPSPIPSPTMSPTQSI